MPEEQFLMPIRMADIEIGKPLPFAVFDSERHLLLNKGVVVVSQNQLEGLQAKGLFREETPERHIVRGALQPGEGEPEPAKAAPSKPREETLDLDALKLMPGDSLQLQPLLEGQTERWNVRVIGMLRNKSLLVSAPLVDGKLIFIKDGQTYLVRAFSGMNACAFKTKVLKSQLQPYPYLHLDWPDSVQAMRIRKAMRAPANLIVAVHESAEGRQTGAARMTDISVGGAKLLSNAALGRKDESLWLSFKVRLSDMEEYVKTHAVIRSIGEEADEQGKPMKAYGVQFDDLSQGQRLIIMNLVYQYVLKEPA